MSFDFLTACQPGMVLQTRDRRAARITAVDKASGLISGEVPMLGACAWKADGRFHMAPAGAAGPWDLMPPVTECAATGQQRQSLAAALNSDDGNPGCCD